MLAPFRLVSLSTLLTALPATLALSVLPAPAAPGDTPPPGPPWQLTYAAAKQLALRKGQPIFTYFTKTY